MKCPFIYLIVIFFQWNLFGSPKPDLPEKSLEVLIKLEEFEKATNRKAQEVILNKKSECMSFLEKQLPEVTRTGNLSQANALNEVITTMKAEIVDLKKQLEEAKSIKEPEDNTASMTTLRLLSKRLEFASRCDDANSFFRIKLDGKEIYITQEHALHVLTIDKEAKILSQRAYGLEGSPELREELINHVTKIDKGSLVVIGVCGTTRNGTYADLTKLVGGETEFIGYRVPFYLFGVRGSRHGAIEATGVGREVSTKPLK